MLFTHHLSVSQPYRTLTLVLLVVFLSVSFLRIHTHDIEASGTTYYVDSTITNTNSASVTPDCTTYNPITFACGGGTDKAFATLADINAFSSTTLPVGDSVLFRKGQAFQKVTGRLTFQPGVTYGAFGTGANPRLEGAGLYPTWLLYSGNIYVASSTLVDAAAFMVWEGDTRGARKTSLGAVATSGDFYLDDPNNNLYYISRGGGNPSQYTIHADTATNHYAISGNNGRLENIIFAYGGAGLVGNLANTGASSGWVISGARFTNAMLYGFSLQGGSSQTSLTFLNSEFDNNVTYGFSAVGPYPTGGMVNTVFHGCSFHDNVIAGISLDGVGTATSSGNIIRHSVAYNNGGDGFVIGVNGVDDIIEDSVAYNNGQLNDDRSGIKSFGLRSIIRRNVSYDNNLNFTSGNGFRFDTVAANGLMYDNIAYGNAAGGISFTGSGHKIYNNTVYNNHGRVAASGGIHTSGSGTFTNVEIKNNIIYNNGQSGVPGSRFQIYDAGRLDDATNRIDGNLYFDAESHTNLVKVNSVDYASVAALAAGTAHDHNGIESDPLLTNAAGNDFTLQSSSPAIDSGLNLGATTTFGLSPTSTWPNSVSTLDQSSNGAGWERGAYVYASAPSTPAAASAPSPATASTSAATSTMVSWTTGAGATSHGIFFGINASPGVSEYRGNQASTTYNPGTLTASTTYYWRIDEVNSVGTTTGTVWSFTTTQDYPGLATSPSPAISSTSVARTATLSFGAGAGATSHGIFFGINASPGVSEYRGNQASTTYNPGTLVASTTYYWRIDEVNTMGTTTGTVWSFTTGVKPDLAAAPSPTSNATNIATTTTLGWTVGANATAVGIYFGTDNTPDEGEYQGNQTASTATYDPVGDLAAIATYYWRIDGVNEFGTTTGTVWSFTTDQDPIPPLPVDSPSSPPPTVDLSVSVGGGNCLNCRKTGTNATSANVKSGNATPKELATTTPVTLSRCSSIAPPATESVGNPSLARIVDLFISLGVIPPDRTVRACAALVTHANNTPPALAPQPFTKPLKFDMTDPDVERLQIFLNTHGFIVAESGYGARGQESTYYGRKTTAAVTRFQEAYPAEILVPVGLAHGSGYFGPATIKKINSFLGI